MGCVYNINGQFYNEFEAMNLMAKPIQKEALFNYQQGSGGSSSLFANEADSVEAREETYLINGKEFNRVSNVTNEFKQIASNRKWFEWQADRVWKDAPKESTKTIQGAGEVSYEEYVEYLKEQDLSSKNKGTILHLMVKKFFNPKQATEIEAEIKKLKDEANLRDFYFK